MYVYEEMREILGEGILENLNMPKHLETIDFGGMNNEPIYQTHQQLG